jgi:hypothetical protein
MSPPPRPSASRYVLRFRGAQAPDGDRARIRAAVGVEVVDDGGRTLLVEAEAPAIAELSKALVGWTIVPESMTPPPGSPRAHPR